MREKVGKEDVRSKNEDNVAAGFPFIAILSHPSDQIEVIGDTMH